MAYEIYLSISLHESQFFFFFFLRLYLFVFRERRKEGEREREKHPCVREISIGCFLRMPELGPASNTGMFPDLPVTFQFAGRH